MSRIPLATDLKTRTAVPDKDARIKNAYVEVRGDQSVVRKRCASSNSISISTGTAQGGIGYTRGGVNHFVGVWGDVPVDYSEFVSGGGWSVGSIVLYGGLYWQNDVPIQTGDTDATKIPGATSAFGTSYAYWRQITPPITPSATRYQWSQVGQCLAGQSNSGFGSAIGAMQDFVSRLNASSSCSGGGNYVYYVVTATTITYSFLGSPIVTPYAPIGLSITTV